MQEKITKPIVVFNHNKNRLFEKLRQVAQSDLLAHRLLIGCVYLWVYLIEAAARYESEKQDLQDHARNVDQMIRKIFNCDSMDARENIHRILLLGSDFTQFYDISQTHPEVFSSVKTYQIEALTLTNDNPLDVCLRYELKCIFSMTAVTTILNNLFNNHHTPKNYGYVPLFKDEDWDRWFDTETKGVLKNYYKMLFQKVIFFPRYCPLIMFLMGGASKLFQLALVYLVSVVDYAEHHDNDCDILHCPDHHHNRIYETLLFLMLVAAVLYEIGQLIEWGFRSYIADMWNVLDLWIHGCLLIWALLLPFPHHFNICRIFLAVSAVPLSLSLLQYLTNIQALGSLIIIIFAMVRDVATFIYIYVVFMLGFAITLYSLYRGQPGFADKSSTFLTLFSATLSTFNFADVDSQGPIFDQYGPFGVIVLILFVTLTAILLVNLLIAKMSTTHDRIESKAFEEWSFLRVRYFPFVMYTTRARLPLILGGCVFRLAA
jgi:hypothetical protein